MECDTEEEEEGEETLWTKFDGYKKFVWQPAGLSHAEEAGL